MRRKVLIFFVVCFAGGSIWAIASSLVKGPTLSLGMVEKKWGSQPFTPETFKSATMTQRATMSASLLRQKPKFLGVHRSEIRKMLGDYSGYYRSGMYPTYLIQEAKTLKEEAWQIVFVINADEKVTDIIVHKNCCDQ
jgi:hypothetical protein